MRRFFPFIVTFGFLLCLLLSCKRQAGEIPVLSIRSGGQYTPDGSVVPVNGLMIFGIDADGMGSNITNFRITVADENRTYVVLDSGLNAERLNWVRSIPKGAGMNETWTFMVMNKARQRAEISLHISRDTSSGWGEILSFPMVIMGMQNNVLTRNFIDARNADMYFPSEVSAAVEPFIDICGYYDPSDEYTLFSPGCSASETYYPCFSSWAVRNYTAWDIHTPVPAAAFDVAINDSLIIVSYDEAYGKKKYKFASPGLVIPFKTAAGKKGLVKVLQCSGNESGTIELSVKIQK